MRALAVLAVLALACTAAATNFVIRNNALETPTPITFDGAKLTPASDAAIDHVRAYLDEKAYITLLRIEAHSDEQGDAKQEQQLTEARALAVAKALVAKGVDCKRLIPVGFGGTKPIAANDTPENRAKNRRIELVNAALRGRPIGGMPVDGGGRVAGDPCK